VTKQFSPFQHPTSTVGRQVVMLNGAYAGSIIGFRGPLISEMLRRGYEVHVTAPDLDAGVRAALRKIGAIPHDIALARTGTNPIDDIKYGLALFRIMREIRPTCVVGYTIKPNIWGSIAARFAGTKSISMVTGLGFAFIPGTDVKRSIVQWIIHRLYAFATAANHRVIFQNPDDIADFCAKGCLAKRQKAALVNGSGVDTDYFAQAPLPDTPIFLMIARFLVSKGTRDYANAAIRVLSERSDCRFRLAGFLDAGPDSISAEELEQWKHQGIEVIGRLDDVRPVVANASIYVLPSYREGTPRTVLEAMSMGRPIITTDVPGCRETVRDGVNGILIPDRDVDALAKAMHRLADSPTLRAQMGQVGRNVALEKYAIERVTAETLLHIGL